MGLCLHGLESGNDIEEFFHNRRLSLSVELVVKLLKVFFDGFPAFCVEPCGRVFSLARESVRAR